MDNNNIMLDVAAELRGSARQVAWAEDIRHAFITRAQDFIAVHGELRDIAWTQCFVGIVLIDMHDACWWIDNRDRLAGASWLRVVAQHIMAAHPDLAAEYKAFVAEDSRARR